MARNGLFTLTAEGAYDPAPEADGPKAIFSFGVFAEVRVDTDLGEVRLNPVVRPATPAGSSIPRQRAARRSAASYGALVEQSETDAAMARFVNRNLSGYLIASNTDIPQLDILFVGEFADEASPLGARGLVSSPLYPSRRP